MKGLPTAVTTIAMQDVVHFHGTYRYATRASLEHAITSARAVLADEDTSEAELAEVAWMRCFVTRGTLLTVNLMARVDRFCAAAVFDTLAELAVEGAVEASLGNTRIDLFASGAND